MLKSTIAPSTCSSLVFIDSAVEEINTLVSCVKPNTEVIILNPNEDGVAQITSVLAGHSGINSIHIVSHGSPGAIELGKTQLSLESLSQYRSQLQQWRDALQEDAQILLYGCHVGATARGEAYLEHLKFLVGTEIAASNNLTGSAAKGGDWNLSVKTGKISATLAFETEVMQAYQGVFSQIFIDEDFSDASGTTDPSGWTSIVIEGNPTTDIWRFDNPGGRTEFEEFLSNPFAIYDSDFLSNENVAENVALVSPVFDASSASQVFLKFDQNYQGATTSNLPENVSKAFVEVYNGSEWQSVYSLVEVASAVGSQILDISSVAAGVENAQVRFRFEGN